MVLCAGACVQTLVLQQVGAVFWMYMPSQNDWVRRSLWFGYVWFGYGLAMLWLLCAYYANIYKPHHDPS